MALEVINGGRANLEKEMLEELFKGADCDEDKFHSMLNGMAPRGSLSAIESVPDESKTTNQLHPE